MAEEVKQRIRAKPQIQASAINNEDLLLMEHAPNTLEDSDKSVRMDQAKQYFVGSLQTSLQTVSGKVDVIEPKVSAMEKVIPTQATETNKLADKDFVNSSVATNTANYIGSFDSLEELEAYEGTVTNNDYAFVKGVDDLGKERDERYKYNASDEEWLFEYYLNNSSFTENQWKAIDSGITAALVALIGQSSGSVPTGVIQPYGGDTAPEGFLLCNGQEVSRSTYSTLFAVIGVKYGVGDGTTTFTLPDFRDRTLQGASDTHALGEKIDAGLPNITAEIYVNTQGNVGSKSGAFKESLNGSERVNWSGNANTTSIPIIKFDASDSNEIYKNNCDTVQPPAQTCNFIIKA